MKKVNKRLIFCITLILFTFLAGEVVFRLYYGLTHTTNILQPSPIRDALYEFKPNSQEKRWGTILKINSLGFRDYEYSLNKPAGITRIFILGDSITMGNIVPLEDTFAKRLEQLLGKKYEVWNLGVSGYDSWKEAAVLKERWIKYDPDIVILAICLNDYSNSFQLYSLDWLGRLKYRDNSKAKYFNWLYYHSDFYRFVYDRLYILKNNLRGTSLPGGGHLQPEQLDNWEVPLRDIARVCRDRKLIFLVFPMQNQEGKFEEGVIFIENFCNLNNIPYLYLGEVLRTEHFCDLLHLNKTGHQITAERIYRFLIEKYK